MKVNGTDSLIKLILELNNQNSRMLASGEKVSIEILSNKVEELLTQRDEVIVRGNSILNPEIQFNRQHHEAPEAYLQRISSEMIKMKESHNGTQEEQRLLLSANYDEVDIALRVGLLKEFVEQYKLKNSVRSDGKETRWLLSIPVSFIALLIIYLIFLK